MCVRASFFLYALVSTAKEEKEEKKEKKKNTENTHVNVIVNVNVNVTTIGIKYQNNKWKDNVVNRSYKTIR